MSDPAPTDEQIKVSPSSAPAAWSRLAQIAVSVGAGMLLCNLIPSEAVRAIVAGPVMLGLAGVGAAIAGGAWAVWQTVRSHRIKMRLADTSPIGRVAK